MERLATRELTVNELARPFRISLPAISKHLRVLEKAGLITRRKDGRIVRCNIDPAPLAIPAVWIERYKPLWEKQLDALDSFLKSGRQRQGR